MSAKDFVVKILELNVANSSYKVLLDDKIVEVKVPDSAFDWFNHDAKLDQKTTDDNKVIGDLMGKIINPNYVPGTEPNRQYTADGIELV